MMTHTPTPWTVEPGDSILKILSGGHRIADVGDAPYWQRFTAEHEANAAFIVRACNAHDALVAALDEMLTSHSMENVGVKASMCRLNAKKQARAALARAKEP